jgi:multimeric flavodoxin WrbA
MKITTIMGSPRKQGNTATVLRWFEECIPPEHTLTRIDVIDYNVGGCTGCDNCQGVYDQCGCSQTDDGEEVLGHLIAADLIVYASPIYCWAFTAQLKALIDRHFCLTKWQDDDVAQSLLEGKRAALLVTCGGSAEENADLTAEMFRRQMECSRCEFLGQYVVPDCSTPDRLGAKGRAVAESLARACGFDTYPMTE